MQVRDLPIGGHPVVLCWRKRIWRCGEPACGVRTWTERVAAIRPRVVLTERAAPRLAGGSARTLMPWPRWHATWGLAGQPSCGRSGRMAGRW
jgi:hypothetical protein